MYRSPQITLKHAIGIYAVRAHHKGNPCVGKEHKHCTHHIQHPSYCKMRPFAEACFHSMPAVVIDIEACALCKEDQRIGKEGGTEDICHIFHEIRIENKECKEKEAAKDGCNGICGQTYFNKFIGQFIIPLVLCSHAYGFDDKDKNRDCEDKCGKP